MNFDIASFVVNMGKVSHFFDWGSFWTTLFATAIGALVAVVLSIWHENKKEYKNNEFELINYFYNLNTALRNIGVFSFNLEKAITEYEQNGQFRILPISTVHFEFNEAKLSFIQPFNHLFYENISQLKIDFNFLYELGLLYKEKSDSKLLYEILHLTVTISNEIVVTMKNINNFLEVYNKKETIIDSKCLENFQKVDEYILDFKNLLQRMNMQNINYEELVKQFEYEITNTKKSWGIEFTPPLPWYKKIINKMLNKIKGEIRK